jgi:hypothetical protein
MAIETMVKVLADPDGLIRKDEALALAAQLREQGVNFVSENPITLLKHSTNHD